RHTRSKRDWSSDVCSSDLCVPYDPASKGGVENAVKIAKADLVPTGVNLRPEYASFAELQAACAQWTHDINHRQHAAGFVPAESRSEEHTSELQSRFELVSA